MKRKIQQIYYYYCIIFLCSNLRTQTAYVCCVAVIYFVAFIIIGVLLGNIRCLFLHILFYLVVDSK